MADNYSQFERTPKAAKMFANFGNLRIQKMHYFNKRLLKSIKAIVNDEKCRISQNMIINLSYKHCFDFESSSRRYPCGGNFYTLHKSRPNKRSHRPGNAAYRNGNSEWAINIYQDYSRNNTLLGQNWGKHTPMQIAQAGFYSRKEGHVVHCFKCSLKTNVDDWLPRETPTQAHARLNANCPFVKDNNFKSLPMAEMQTYNSTPYTQPKVKDYQTKITLRESYQETTESLETDGHFPSGGHRNDSGILISNASDAMNSQLETGGVEIKYSQFKDITSRLLSFAKWIYESIQKAEDLAVAGYFYTGENDIVRCFCCDLGLAEWDPRDDPWIEHARHSPTCWFLIKTKGDGFVQATQREWKQIYNPKHTQYEEKDSRLHTYDEWRSDIDQTPELLAEAGFFFTGEEDIVRCHYCDGGLRNWEPGDDPWEEHTRWFPFCKFVIKMKGREYIETIRQQTQQQPTQDHAENDINTEVEMTRQQVIDQLRQLQISNEDINSAINCFEKQREVKAMTVQWMMEVIYHNKSPFAVGNEKKEEPVEKDPKKLLETNRMLKKQLKCMRCNVVDACMVFVNCGHRVTCEICAEKMDFCIHCNTKVKKRIKTFLS